MLLDHANVDVNSRNSSGKSSLHLACGQRIASHIGAQLLLGDARCDVNRPTNDDGETALMITVQYVTKQMDTHAKLIRLLLDHPSIDVKTVNQRNKSGDASFQLLQLARCRNQLLQFTRCRNQLLQLARCRKQLLQLTRCRHQPRLARQSLICNQCCQHTR